MGTADSRGVSGDASWAIAGALCVLALLSLSRIVVGAILIVVGGRRVQAYASAPPAGAGGMTLLYSTSSQRSGIALRRSMTVSMS